MHARESASDTCYTDRVRGDTWRDREGEKEKTVRAELHVRESLQQREGGLYTERESG